MGVADRSYMRGRGPPPIAIGSSWTLRFVVMLAAFFVLSRGAEGWFRWRGEDAMLLSRDAIAQGRVWTLVTAALLHVDVLHLLFNLLGLWYFGKLVEETLGGVRFFAFFWMAAVLSHVPYLAVQYATGDSTPTIGASGIVMAALVFAALRYPGLPLSLMGFPIVLWQVAAVYVAIDLFGALRGGDIVDHWTHLGGAAFGFAVHKFGLLPRFGGLRGILPHGGRPPRAPGPYADADPRERIDRLLDKIGREGIAALTDEEREFLKRESGRYR